MDLRQLEMFLAVVERGSYLQAGSQLHVSHSAIHRQIRLLEEELGEKVLVKRGKNVRPNEAGVLLTETAHTVHREIAQLRKQIRDLRALQSGQLRIGTGTTTLTFFLPPVLERFHQQYPEVDIHVVTGTADHLIRQLNAGDLDLGIVSEPPEGPSSEKHLHYDPMYEEEFALAVTRRHPLFHRKSVAWTELQDLPFIAFTRESRVRHLIDARFRQVGVEPRIVMELENEEAIEKMIEINLGIGFLSLRRTRSEHLHAIRIRGERIFQRVAAVRSNGYVPAKTKEFLRLCTEQISQTN